MAQSKQEIPHFYVTAEAALDDTLAWLEATNGSLEQGERITLTACLIAAVAKALASHPEFNAHWTEDGVLLLDEVNIGVAIAVDEGLLAPALLDCAGLEVATISSRLRDLATRARDGGLRSREMSDATFTLSNLGMFDVASFIAIVNPPQVAILATGAAMSRPVIEHGEVVPRTVMSMTLSADHRAVDGAGAASFLGTVKNHLERGVT